MREKELPKIGSEIAKGWLLGTQSADYFDFVCGGCGNHLGRIMVDDVDSVGLRFTAECENCKKEWAGMKISARWGKNMTPHIKARFNEISEKLRHL